MARRKEVQKPRHSRKLLAGALGLLALAAAAVAAVRIAQKTRPTGWNLVLLSVDTLRADHLSSYGATFLRTPNMDRLASEGVLYENVSTVAPTTLPSHASLFTGLTPVVSWSPRQRRVLPRRPFHDARGAPQGPGVRHRRLRRSLRSGLALRTRPGFRSLRRRRRRFRGRGCLGIRRPAAGSRRSRERSRLARLAGRRPAPLLRLPSLLRSARPLRAPCRRGVSGGSGLRRLSRGKTPFLPR